MSAKILVLCLFFFSVLAFAAPKEDFEDVVVVKWIDTPEIDQPWGKESKFFAPTHVRWGNAWANRQFRRKGDTSSRLIAAEEKARDNRNGLWDTNKSPIPPWEWRKKKGK